MSSLALKITLFCFELFHNWLLGRIDTPHPATPWSHILLLLFSHVQLFVTTWTAACQASLSFTISRVCSKSCPYTLQWGPWGHKELDTTEQLNWTDTLQALIFYSAPYKIICLSLGSLCVSPFPSFFPLPSIFVLTPLYTFDSTHFPSEEFFCFPQMEILL